MRVAVLYVALLATPAAHAQVDPTLQAGRLADNCLSLLQQTGNPSFHAECVMRVSGFLYGWSAGVERGLVYGVVAPAAKNERETSAALVARVERMSVTARCVTGSDFHSLMKGFLDFVAEKPSRRVEHYGAVLQAYLLAKYCDK